MKSIKKLAVAVLGASLGLAGCSLRPLPSDVTREKTSDIVLKIWCETRRAIDELTIQALRENRGNFDRYLDDEIADRLEIPLLDPRVDYDESYFPQFVFNQHEHRLSPDAKLILGLFSLTAIGFDYRFFITENDSKSANISLVDPFRMIGASANFSLAAGGSLNKQRSTERRFAVVSTYLEIQREHALTPFNCFQRFARAGTQRRLLYPITGTIGVKEVMDTFSRLYGFGLGGRRDGPQRFTDKLVFTTTLDASIKPSLSVTALPMQGLRLASADATLRGARSDVHEVTISLNAGEFVASVAEAEKALAKIGRDNKQRVIDEFGKRRFEDLIVVRR